MKHKKQRPNYSPEVRERAVRLVREHLDNYPSRWATIESIAGKIGCTAQTGMKAHIGVDSKTKVIHGLAPFRWSGSVLGCHP